MKGGHSLFKDVFLLEDIIKLLFVPFFEEDIELLKLLLEDKHLGPLNVVHPLPPTFNPIDKIGI